jgi:hypothetical protein
VLMKGAQHLRSYVEEQRMASVGRLADIIFQFLVVHIGVDIKVEGERYGPRTKDPLAHEVRCQESSNPYVNCRPEQRVRPGDIPPTFAEIKYNGIVVPGVFILSQG